MKLKVIVLTCPQNHNTRVKAIKETWGKHYDTIYLSDYNADDKIIGYPYLENGYENIWKKYVEFIKNEKTNTDWYYFCDDDTFVNIFNLNLAILSIENSNDLCFGNIGLLNSDGTDKIGTPTGFHLHTLKGNGCNLPVEYAGGGGGFFMNSETFRKLQLYILSEDNIPNCYNGDVTFGFWTRGAGIKYKNIANMWWASPEMLAHNEEQQKFAVSYHYITPEKMYELHEKLNK